RACGRLPLGSRDRCLFVGLLSMGYYGRPSGVPDGRFFVSDVEVADGIASMLGNVSPSGCGLGVLRSVVVAQYSLMLVGSAYFTLRLYCVEFAQCVRRGDRDVRP